VGGTKIATIDYQFDSQLPNCLANSPRSQKNTPPRLVPNIKLKFIKIKLKDSQNDHDLDGQKKSEQFELLIYNSKKYKICNKPSSHIY
jgi:hypothetical protein